MYAAADEAADLADRDGQGGGVGAAGGLDLREHPQRSLDLGAIGDAPGREAGCGVCLGAGAEDLGGEGGLLGVQVVAQRGPGESLPQVLAGERLDPGSCLLYTSDAADE